MRYGERMPGISGRIAAWGDVVVAIRCGFFRVARAADSS
jgi:hypothetical protein